MKRQMRMAHAIEGGIVLIYQVFDPRPISVIAIRTTALKDGSWDAVRDSARLPGSMERIEEIELHRQLRTGMLLPREIVEQALDLLPRAAEEPILSSLHYYEQSLRDYSFLGDSVSEILEDRSRSPEGPADRIRAEQSVLNAFKSVEMLIGEPPRDDRKLRAKLVSVGVDPDLRVGYGEDDGASRVTLMTKIRELHTARDKRAAHAKTGADPLTYFDVMDLQECARTVLLESLELHVPL